MAVRNAGGSTSASLKESIWPTLSAAPRSRHRVPARRSTLASDASSGVPPSPPPDIARLTAAAAAPAASPMPKPPKWTARETACVGTARCGLFGVEPVAGTSFDDDGAECSLLPPSAAPDAAPIAASGARTGCQLLCATRFRLSAGSAMGGVEYEAASGEGTALEASRAELPSCPPPCRWDEAPPVLPVSPLPALPLPPLRAGPPLPRVLALAPPLTLPPPPPPPPFLSPPSPLLLLPGD